MLFNSDEFVFFFAIVTMLYFLLPHKHRWVLLLFASCCFYMAFIPVYILILFATIIIDYAAGLIIAQSTGKIRKITLIGSIVSTCLVLFSFKYINFFIINAAALTRFLGWNYSISVLDVILPIGLSFHTFQSLSYVIEVYRGNQQPERHFGIYALYVMFYPQLVAGPIERPQNLLHQFREEHHFNYERVKSGIQMMLWGTFKKVVVADRLAFIVNDIYSDPGSHGPVWILTATVFFAFQIYCDFSGYSDIALGSAKVMGFDLMQNFKYPYFARSIAEFWKRWHISLSTWFRDYVYIPLGGNQASRARWYSNLFVTFLISGFWHGANWTFVIWGGINAIYLISGLVTFPYRTRFSKMIGLEKIPNLHTAIQTINTFALTCFAWIFFRSESVKEALAAIYNLNPFDENISSALTSTERGQFVFYTLVGFFLIGLLLLVEMIESRGLRLFEYLATKPIYVRWPCYYCFAILFMLFGAFHNPQQFIYFQF